MTEGRWNARENTGEIMVKIKWLYNYLMVTSRFENPS
jgi:hypothetical protein